MNKKKIIYPVIVILLLVIAIAGYISFNKTTGQIAKLNYDQGFEAARNLYTKVCVPPTANPAEINITSLYGKIIAVQSDGILVEANPIGLNGTEKKTVTVKIDGNTEIKQVVLKDETEYKNELSTYQTKIATNAQDLNPAEPPPSQYKQVSINITDLKTGHNVTVSVIGNITATTDEVTASQIIVDFAK